MYPQLQTDLDNFPAILDQARGLAVEFLQGLDARLVAAPESAQAISAEDGLLPETGQGAAQALQSFWRAHQAGLSASAGPRYFGFVTGGGTPAAVAADWLVSVIDQNALLSHDTIAPAIELATIRQLRALLGLPEAMSGSFVSGATMANFVGLAIGRQWLGKQRGVDVAAAGMAALGPLRVLSTGIHASTVKAMSMLGLGRDALVHIAALPGTEAMDPQALAQALAAAPDVPSIVVASAGTVNTVAFDALPAVLALREQHHFWLHVDAAFGGVAACAPQFAHLFTGWEAADSITVDAHKWLNVPYDSAIQFTRHLDCQLEVFQNHSPYMEPPTARADNYLHLTPENSRRWRALPVWLALRAYGRAGMAEVVERNVALVRRLGAALSEEQGFRLLAPVNLNVVCFALEGIEGDADSARDRFLDLLYADGAALCTPTRLFGQPGIRAALVNWRTTAQDIELTVQALRRCRVQLAGWS